jgi:hypothetical protein
MDEMDISCPNVFPKTSKSMQYGQLTILSQPFNAFVKPHLFTFLGIYFFSYLNVTFNETCFVCFVLSFVLGF